MQVPNAILLPYKDDKFYFVDVDRYKTSEVFHELASNNCIIAKTYQLTY